ncbi:hypothetical protein EJ03DRAFT_33110 [Teratosphaeria nubilosa]|uniref:uS12 prolyl 3,4-dihydroxylase n=1 Tax=Teratosphaeria nubilosa TaxID=161662 RepID=A0A6G1KVH7_9PEZI|nr:hypothetical protein EJ03DRAFT_33110 [Teratosphaeria nubilosa]
MVKRKADAVDSDPAAPNGHSKKATIETAIANEDIKSRFGPDIFDSTTIDSYTSNYATSAPYRHAVIKDLIDDSLLRSVRTEILDNIHFTPKETDIYKIHQSGDLANLDGLDPAALQKLPSLLQLRDALYSKDFRNWISKVSGAGPVSGKKTDMAVNVYVPGCHLLCHDDVIGSRRVSYILYLTDPENPWRAEWGGALRLYATDERRGEDCKTYKVPRAEWSKVIPPAWNQLSFFEVVPGESFHDVEEVYHRSEVSSEGEEIDGGRCRMAISGWFHVPQEGEEGYEEGLEERLAEKSSLQQLQGKAEQFDEPQFRWEDPIDAHSSHDDDEAELSERDLEFLLQYLTPNYLTPDTVEELNELFAGESMLQLTNFLSPRFAARLKEHMEATPDAPTNRAYATSKPPHKHRYQYLYPSLKATASSSHTPLELVLDDLLPSLSFRKWLSLVSGLTLRRCAVLSRRFRKSLDYQLAQSYEGEQQNPSHTGAGNRRSAKQKKADPAIYKAASDGEDDDGILFSNPAAWNTMSIVLRDRGTLKFVKYVSQKAKGDRYDFTGAFEVDDDEDDEDDTAEDVGKGAARDSKAK